MEEARGLREGDDSRPGGLVVLDFTAPGRHLILDGVVTAVYKNSVLSRVAMVPGFAAKKMEDTNFKAARIRPTRYRRRKGDGTRLCHSRWRMAA